MKKINLFFIVTILAFVAITTSCKKDEEQPIDVRDQAVGNYDGTVYLYLPTSTSVEDTSWAEPFSVKKNSDNSSSIDFIIEGKAQLKGTKIAEASNGFSFDIEEQTIEEDGISYNIKGINFVELGGTKYHGAYDSNDKDIAAAFTISISGIDMIMVYYGKKK